MKLNQDDYNFIAEMITSEDYRTERKNNYDRYMMYNGNSIEIIKENFEREFKQKETIRELKNRVVPLNITQKIINKLSQVYTESPLRYATNQNPDDDMAIGQMEDILQINKKMKKANREFKHFKTSLIEIYLDDEGEPCLRVLPRHTYEVFAIRTNKVEDPNVYCKILRDSHEKEKVKISVFSDESHAVINGSGEIDWKEMNSKNNPDLVNPYGEDPYIFINESDDTVRPVQDDDLTRMAILIPILLSDLNYAIKYQCWSIIYTIGDVGDIPFSPNSVISLPFGPNGATPSINTVKPNVDSEKITQYIEKLLSALLSTKNLQSATVKLNSNDVISGISKMLDSAESVEDRSDQESYFLYAEYELWEKLTKNLIPYWRQNNMLNEESNIIFSDDFEISVIFKEPKVLMSDKEKIELEHLKESYGYTTKQRALKEIYPEMTNEEIQQLEQEIEDEESSKFEKELNSFGLESNTKDKPS